MPTNNYAIYWEIGKRNGDSAGNSRIMRKIFTQLGGPLYRPWRCHSHSPRFFPARHRFAASTFRSAAYGVGTSLKKLEGRLFVTTMPMTGTPLLTVTQLVEARFVVLWKT